jgi:hypothetical protein
VFGIVDQAFIQVAQVFDVWSFGHELGEQFPGVDYDDLQLFYCLMNAGSISIAGLVNETQDAEFRQAVICSFSRHMFPGSEGVPSDNFGFFQTLIYGVASDYFTSDDFPVSYEAMRQVYLTALVSIGAGDMEKITQYTTPTEQDNCDCPVPELPPNIIGPTANGWYLSEPLSFDVGCPGGFNYGYASFLAVADHDCYGVMYTYERLSGFPINRLKPAYPSVPVGGYNVYWFVSNSDHDGEATTYLQHANQAYAQIAPLVTNPVQKNVVGKCTDTIATPIVLKDQIMLATLAGQASGGDNDYVVVRFTVRWLQNLNSPSHQP